MSHWNHRVVKRTFHRNDGKVDELWGIHEAFCDDSGKVWSITEKGVAPGGNTLKELKEDWLQMSSAFCAPVLDFDLIPEPGAIHPNET